VDGQQVSVIVAAVFIAVLFADRLGGSAALARRVYQVSLGLVLALAVIAGTNAFIRPPELPVDALSSGDILTGGSPEDLDPNVLEDFANKASESATVRAGAAILAIVAGVAMLQRYKVTGLGVATGGLILVLFSGSGIGASCNGGAFNTGAPSLSFASEGRDIAQFVVLLVGSLVMAGYGVWRWDNRTDGEPDPAPTASL